MTQKILYVGAHQDDIELSMGSSVRRHLAARDETGTDPLYEIHTLICTTGENSGARPPGMLKPEFARARDDEATRAARALGVRFENMHFADPRPPDGALDPETAMDLLAGLLDDLGIGTWVKTHSSLPIPGVRHSDHVNLGEAAWRLQLDGLIPQNGLRMYVEPYQRAAFEVSYPIVGLITEPPGQASIEIVRRALREYSALDGIGSKYGFGYKSVKSAFDQVISNPTSYCHLP